MSTIKYVLEINFPGIGWMKLGPDFKSEADARKYKRAWNRRRKNYRRSPIPGRVIVTIQAIKRVR